MPAASHNLKGNESIALDDASRAWIVVQGSVALFGVALRDGIAAGPRRHLFTVERGELICGFARQDAAEGATVLAVALEDAVLLDAAGLRAGDRAPPGGRPAAELARAWLDRWRSCGLGPESPSPGGLEPGQEKRPLVEGLRERHAAILAGVRELTWRERERGRDRIRRREQRSAEAVRDALGGLTSLLGANGEAVPEGTGLFAAASVVGAFQGIRLDRPPSREKQEGQAARVEAIARASRVRVRKVVLEEGWWRRDCGALLAFHGDEGRPVALLPGRDGGYRLVEPGGKVRARVDAAVAAALDPEAWIFYRPLPREATGTLDLAHFALRGRARDLAAIAATATLATLLGMFTPQATALLVDHAIPDSDIGLLGQIGLGLLAATLGIAVFRWSQGLAMMRLETAADAATQPAVWDRLLNLQVSFFRRFTTGDLESRVTAISQIRAYLGGATLRTLFSGVLLLLNLGLLLYYSPLLTLLAVAVAALSCAVTVLSGVRVLHYSRRALELKGRFFGLMVQLINGVAKLRVAAAEERAFGRWAREYSELLKLELRQRRIQDVVRVINVAVSTLSAILLFSFAAALILREGTAPALSTGVFLAFHVAYGTFIGAIGRLSNTVTDVMAIAILRERALPILEAEPEIGAGRADPGRLSGRVEIDHVAFQYREDGPVILDDVSMRVEPGQFVALVGPSGSGKSTLLRLLLGFESPRSGGIYFDGQDLAGLDVHAVRRQMGVVLQNGRINSGSIYENIVSGTRLSLDDAWVAARAAGFAEEIEAMPMGMHTIISEGGTNLSGGQRQRLLVTRALVHGPRVLLLDEATSALDNKTQAIVSDSLNRLDVTRIVIAHRLSTVRSADRIHVVDAGRIVEQGTFKELAARDGLFARLMARQMT